MIFICFQYFTRNRGHDSQFGCNFVNLPLLNDKGDEVFAAGGIIYRTIR